jgi:hypothetical protein
MYEPVHERESADHVLVMRSWKDFGAMNSISGDFYGVRFFKSVAQRCGSSRKDTIKKMGVESDA